MDCGWDIATLLAFIYLIANPFFPAAHVLSILFSQFVSSLWAERIAMMLVFLGSVLTVAFTPFGLLLASHKLVKLVVMPLSFALLVSAAMLFVPLATTVTFPLLLVTLNLTPTTESPLNQINHFNMTNWLMTSIFENDLKNMWLNGGKNISPSKQRVHIINDKNWIDYWPRNSRILKFFFILRHFSKSLIWTWFNLSILFIGWSLQSTIWKVQGLREKSVVSQEDRDFD